MRRRLTAQPRVSYLLDLVYGAIDGPVTTFAVVAGVEGADMSANIELVPEGEREEIRQLYATKGLHGADLERIVEVIASDRRSGSTR